MFCSSCQTVWLKRTTKKKKKKTSHSLVPRSIFFSWVSITRDIGTVLEFPGRTSAGIRYINKAYITVPSSFIYVISLTVQVVLCSKSLAKWFLSKMPSHQQEEREKKQN